LLKLVGGVSLRVARPAKQPQVRGGVGPVRLLDDVIYMSFLARDNPAADAAL
jgi:hypothetical protein